MECPDGLRVGDVGAVGVPADWQPCSKIATPKISDTIIKLGRFLILHLREAMGLMEIIT